VASEQVKLDTLAGIVEIRLLGNERRWLIDGETPFGLPADGILRIGIGAKRDLRGPLMEGLLSDSSVTLRVPDVNLDSEAVHGLTLEFFTGANPLVLISGSGEMPRKSLNYVVRSVADAVRKADWRNGRFIMLADGLEYLGLWVLNGRIRRVEESVREALGDDDFSAHDLDVLQGYPRRLAKVELAASSLRSNWPEVKSARPSSGILDSLRVTPNLFGKHVDEATQDAKDAVGRLSGLISSQQIVLSQRQARETARFQRVVTIVGATVLVPGLVAAVFGANVGFHGRDGGGAFWAMLLLMGGSAMATYALVRSIESGLWRPAARWAPFHWIASSRPKTRLVLAGLAGTILLALGGVVLADSHGPDSKDAGNSASNGKGAIQASNATQSGKKMPSNHGPYK
jgi:hypothetical protein